MFLGLGALVGATLYGRFGQRFSKEKLVLTCMLLSGIFTALFAVATKSIPYLWISGVTMFILGLSLGPITVSLYTMVHESIPQETRGRIFSSLEAVIHLGFLIFMFVAAVLADHIAKAWILIFCGVLFFVWGAVGILAKRKTGWLR